MRALKDYSTAMDKLSKLDIYIDDSANMSIGSILTSVRAFIRKHGIKVIVFDHFSLIGYDGGNGKGAAYERKEEISRGVARIIKEEEVAGLTLVQLGRDAQNRRPRLSDLSDTKALEQDANNVLMIWNPIHGDKIRRVLCCEKGRDGGSGDYYINFEGDTAKAYSMEPQEQEGYYSEIERGANHSQRG
jgi:replicative DNA helicase